MKEESFIEQELPCMPPKEEVAEEKELTVYERLCEKFPEDKIKNRIINDGQKEKVISYVIGADVIRRLNECFGINWSFTVIDKIIDVDLGQIAVLGELSMFDAEVGVRIKKQQWGSSQISCFSNGRVISLGDDIKTATTDSLKKCATMFGVALYLYDGDERGNITNNAPTPVTKEAKDKIESYREDNKPITKAQTSSIIRISKDNNVPMEKILEILGVNDISKATYQKAASFIVEWKKILGLEEDKTE